MGKISEAVKYEAEDDQYGVFCPYAGYEPIDQIQDRQEEKQENRAGKDHAQHLPLIKKWADNTADPF